MPTGWIPVVAAGITALVAGVVAITGYLVAQAQTRRERKARAFSDALNAVVDYIQLPYVIARRRQAIPVPPEGNASVEAEAASRADVNSKENEAQAKMYFNLSWLQVEAPYVAKHYDALVQKARELGHRYRLEAWKERDLEKLTEGVLSTKYSYKELDKCWTGCIAEMRKALYPRWRRRRRQKVLKEVCGQNFSAPFSALQERSLCSDSHNDS